MLQKELAKRLKARYDTKMDGNGWLEVSSDGILEKYPPEWKEETPAPSCRTEPLRYISISLTGRTRTTSVGLPYRP